MRALLAVGVFLAVVLGVVWADGCCMVPLNYGGDVDQNAQQVTLLHHDGHQELVVRVAPFFQGTEELPGYLAWVLTVPSKPTGYAVADRAVFEEASKLSERLQDLAEWQEARRSKFSNPFPRMAVDGAALAVNSAAKGELEVSAPIRVGPYDITEVKAKGLQALDALNKYLEERAFPQEDPAHMKWFVENDFTFLCIYIRPPEGKDKLGKKLDLEPLQVGFATQRPYYPGMFSSQQGNFALRMTTITSKPLQKQSLRGIKRKLRARSGTYANLWTEKALPQTVAKVAQAAPGFVTVDHWHVNSMVSFGFNQSREGRPRIADWKEDVLFALGGEADAPPSWYYGDRDISKLELFWREHQYATLVWAAILALIVLLVVRLRGRRARQAA